MARADLLAGLLPSRIAATIGCFMIAYNIHGCCCCWIGVIECRRIAARYSDLYTLRRRVLIPCHSFARIDHTHRGSTFDLYSQQNDYTGDTSL